MATGNGLRRRGERKSCIEPFARIFPFSMLLFALHFSCLPQLKEGNVPHSPPASPAPLALSCSASSWGRMHFARCQRFFLLLPPIRFLFPLLQEYTLCASLHTSSSSSVDVLCLRFCFCFCFFSLSVSDKPLRVFPSRSTSADGGFVILARLITEFRSVCLMKFWSTPLKILLITPERLFKS